MAKRNQQDPISRKRAEPVQEQEEEKDIDAGEKDANSSEHQLGEQNTLGNTAIATLHSQMISGDDGANPDGQGGGGGLAQRTSKQDNEVDYGGDADADDLPLTLEDLVRSWNPTTNKTLDRPSWSVPMPTDELPPEDQDYLDEVRRPGTRRIQAGFTLEAQLQPSAAIVAGSLVDWCNEAMKWCGDSVLERSMARILCTGSSFIQDPDGRAVLTRARMAAATSQLLLASPGLQGTPATSDVAFLMFCLELSGHRRHAELVRISPGVEGKKMPESSEVFDRCFEGPPRSVTPRALPDGPRARMQTLLGGLFDMEDPGVYLPSLEAVVPEEEDDPLGLNALLIELTGGKTDPEDALYYSALQAAERIAASAARMRIHTAAVAVTIAQVAKQWSSGAPTETLRSKCRSLDTASDKSLRLLVEIARAARKRNVPPRGLKAGLTRATRGLRKVHKTTLDAMSEVVGGILPGFPGVLPQAKPVQDPLSEAWDDGAPKYALEWLASLPQTTENRAALLLTQAAAGHKAYTLGEPMLEIAAALDSPQHANAMRIMAAPCLLAGGHVDLAVAISEQHLEVAARNRNGALLADAAITGMEALPPEASRELWLRAGRLAHELGAPGALTVLARYTPRVQE